MSHLLAGPWPGSLGQGRRRARAAAAKWSWDSLSSTAGAAGTARGRIACRPTAKGPEPLARPCSAFWLLPTRSAFFCWWTGDAWLLLLFRADDKELRFLFCGSQGDSFSRFAVLCLSINFKNLAKVSVPGAPDTSPDTQDSQSAFSLSQETAVPKGVSSLLQVQRHSPEVVKGAKGTNVGEAPGQERRVEAIRASASAALPFMASAFRCGRRPHA